MGTPIRHDHVQGQHQAQSSHLSGPAQLWNGFKLEVGKFVDRLLHRQPESPPTPTLPVTQRALRTAPPPLPRVTPAPPQQPSTTTTATDNAPPQPNVYGRFQKVVDGKVVPSGPYGKLIPVEDSTVPSQPTRSDYAPLEQVGSQIVPVDDLQASPYTALQFDGQQIVPADESTPTSTAEPYQASPQQLKGQNSAPAVKTYAFHPGLPGETSTVASDTQPKQAPLQFQSTTAIGPRPRQEAPPEPGNQDPPPKVGKMDEGLFAPAELQQQIKDGVHLEHVNKPAREGALPGWVQQAYVEESKLHQNTQIGPAKDAKAMQEPDVRHFPPKFWGRPATESALQGLGHALLVAKPSSGVIGTTTAVPKSARQLGELMATQISTWSAELQHSFVLSTDDHFSQQLLDLMRDHVPALPATLAELEPGQRTLIEQARDEASKLLSDRAIETDPPNPQPATERPTQVKIGGEVYAQKEWLGSGQFGDVYRFTSASGKSVAIKFAKSTETDPRLEGQMLLETKAKASDPRAQHMTHLISAMKAPNGELMLATPFIDGYRASNLDAKITSALNNGVITAEQALAMRLTVMHDVVLGMGFLQSDKNIVHYDVRGDNIMIDQGGQAVVIDLGLARDQRDGEQTAPEKLPIKWTAPEALGQDPQANLKSDTFSVGLMAYEAYFGQLPQTQPGPVADLAAVRQARVDFSKNPDNRVVPLQQTFAPPDSAPSVQTEAKLGLNMVTKLINSMLHPDPEQRPTLAAVANSEVFKQPGVGSDETRKLMTQLLDGSLPTTPSRAQPNTPNTTTAPAISTEDVPSVYVETVNDAQGSATTNPGGTGPTGKALPMDYVNVGNDT